MAPLAKHQISIDFKIDINAKVSLAAARGVFCIDEHTRFWANLRPKKVVINRIWQNQLGIYFWKSACVDKARSRPKPPRGPKGAKWAILARNVKITKPMKNQWMFAFVGLKRAMTHCDKIVDVATKSLKIHWFLVFSEIEAVKRLLVDRVFIDPKSNFRGRICCKNDCFSTILFFRLLIDGEDEKIRILRFIRGFILKVDIRNGVRPDAFH